MALEPATSSDEVRSYDLGDPIATGASADIYRRGATQVIKLFRADSPQHAIEAEVRNSRLVREAGVATPRVVDTVTINGRRGIVFERVEGPTLFQVLCDEPQHAELLARLFALLHSEIHERSCPELGDVRTYLRDQIAGCSLLTGSERRALDAILNRLPGGTAICHGDFQPTNIIVTHDGRAPIDWSHASRGDATADVANTMFILRYAPIDPKIPQPVANRINAVRAEFAEAYFNHYTRSRPVPQLDLNAWTACIVTARLANPRAAAHRGRLASLLNSLLEHP